VSIAYPAEGASKGGGENGHGSGSADGHGGTATTPGITYSISVFMDGRLDTKMDFSNLVLGNAETLCMFRDVSHLGG